MLKPERVGHNDWIFRADWPQGAEARFHQAIDLMQEGKPEAAELRLRELLIVCPEHIDAWHHLALLLDDAGDSLMSYACTREAVRLGLDALPRTFSWLTSRLEWHCLENRPFLRAYHNLGVYLLDHGGVSEALEVFSRLLSVSPHDSLGVRYLVMECHLALQSWEAVLQLATQLEDDIAPMIIYSKVIALLALDDASEAEACLRDAVARHPKVASELLKSRHVRPALHIANAITLGGDDEAFYYWERNKEYWAKTTPAHALLRQVAGRKKGS